MHRRKIFMQSRHSSLFYSLGALQRQIVRCMESGQPHPNEERFWKKFRPLHLIDVITRTQMHCHPWLQDHPPQVQARAEKQTFNHEPKSGMELGYQILPIGSIGRYAKSSMISVVHSAVPCSNRRATSLDAWWKLGKPF